MTSQRPQKKAKTSHYSAKAVKNSPRSDVDDNEPHPIDVDEWQSDHEAEMEALRESEQAPPLESGKSMDNSAWSRRAHAKLNPLKDNLEVMQVDADKSSIPHTDGSAVIHLFGLTREGASVLVNVQAFHHYFYVPAALTGISADSMRQALESHLRKSLDNDANKARFMGKAHNNSALKMVIDVKVVKKRSIMNYIPGDPELDFYKITLRNPGLVRYARDIIRRGGLQVQRKNVDGLFRLPEQPTFEASLDYVLRFMIEVDLGGCSWLTLPAKKYKLREGAKKTTHAQIEVDVLADDVIAHKPEGRFLDTAPMRRLSFDIECAGRKGVFPEPEHDSVIQIANYVVDHGSDTPLAKVVFTLNTCAPIVGAKVLSYKTEEELLAAWSKFMRAADPDVLTGYNIVNFDLPYLIDRAAKLKVTEFPFLGRLRGSRTTMKNTKMSSSAFGTHESKSFTIHGRVIYDMLQLITREYKLRSYSLNSVSAEFLGEQKEDVHYSIISDLQGGDEQTRRRLAVYCLKDAFLPIRLMDKLMFLTNYSEMARVTGIPLGWLVSRGHMVKVVSLLHKKAHIKDFLIPDTERRAQGGDDGGPQFEGATVIEPKKGYYSEPIATLDFASLYPSIIQAHNLCYSTLVRPEHVSKLSPDDVEKTPTGNYFVKRKVKEGILTTMLEELLSARKKAKKALKGANKLLDAAKKLEEAKQDVGTPKDVQETNIAEARKVLGEVMEAQGMKDEPSVKELELKSAVINGRQLALKVSANAIYGFTGASVGKLPCMEISASTTAYGRDMIEFTKEQVLKKYGDSGADVVYGDTDSVMIQFGKDKTLAECMKLGEEAADAISSMFPKPVKLEFEKCYYPYLLISKKRYAGLLWTNTEKPDKMDCKGIESVRRDNCRLVANVIDSVLKLLLEKREKEKAVQTVKDVISNLLQNKIDISLLVVSKALTKVDYDNKQAHVELANKLRKRDAGTAPSLGDRVPYVIIKGTKNEPAYSRSEDPLYVLENNLPIDNNYYLENMLRKPLERIFEPILKDGTSSLFAGEHTRSVKVVMPKAGGMLKFTKVRLTCLGCKTPIKEGALCKHCLPKEGDIYMKQLEVVQELERNYSSLWTECQRCMGDICHDVLCSNGDCPIFYRRRKVQKDLDDSTARMARFQLEW